MKLYIISEDLTSRLPRLHTILDKNTNNPYFKRLIKNIGTNNVIEHILQYDPTNQDAKYIEWILNQVMFGNITIPDDGDRLLRSLTIFNNAKNSPALTNNNDINKFKSLTELEKIIRPLESHIKSNQPLSIRQWKNWVKKQGYTIFYGDTVYTVLKFESKNDRIPVVPITDEDGINYDWLPAALVQSNDKYNQNNVKHLDIAAVSLATWLTGTNYCVQNPATAESYMQCAPDHVKIQLKPVPIYLILKNNKIYTLANSSWSEFKNTEDLQLAMMSPSFAYFTSKMIINKSNDLTATGIKMLKNKITETLKNNSTLPNKAKSIMVQAIHLNDPMHITPV